MNTFLYSFVICVFFFSIHAQSQNPQAEIQILVQRVDSLEHELSYLKLTYELNTLNSDISMFTNEVYIKSIAIQLDIYNKNIDLRLGDAYQRYYKACQGKKQAFSKLIEAKKNIFAVKVITYPYSESELNTLMASYKVINDAFNLLENSMDLLKITIDTYIKFM